MVEIIPAIMPKSLEDIVAEAHRVETLVRMVQVDVMDGIFVPSADWPYTADSDAVFDAMASGGISLAKDGGGVSFEIDLMVENPALHAGDWLAAGAKRIIFHIESLDDPSSLFEELPRDGFEIGLALNPDTSNDAVASYIQHIDFVQCMGITNIGYQGQAFDERVLGKLRVFRETFPSIVLSVDGGVSLDIAPKLIEAGANRLVSGSAIWQSDDILGTIVKFQSLEQ